MRFALVFAIAAVCSSQALAADLVVELKTATGQPVTDAVVSFKPNAGVPPGAISFAPPYAMSQQNIAFSPFVLIVPVGADVGFPNKDKVRHHVYSFSPAKKFELKLYGRDETRTVHFDKPGVVALGCNIHDSMIGFVVVMDTPFAAKTPASGQVTLANLPPGGGVLTIWQPYLRAPNNAMTQPIVIPAQGQARQAFTLSLREPPPKKMKM